MGRIDYISSGEEQEHLYAVYQTQPEEYWMELAKENRDSFFRSGTKGTCIDLQVYFPRLPESTKKISIYGVQNWGLSGSMDIRLKKQESER